MDLIGEHETIQNKDPSEGEEEEEVALGWIVEGEEEEKAQVELGLVGKLWTDRNVNSPALIAQMRRIWNPKHGMEGNCIERNIFFFQFYHWKDTEFVMNSQPWHFDRHVLALNNVHGEIKPS